MWQVIGQTKAVSLLQHSVERGTVSHAYLFVGPAHAGKMKLALTLAQALNCPEAKPPCGECPTCRKIETGKHSDIQIIVMNGEGSEENRAKISVEQIEELQHSASLPPFEGKHKVFIIDGAEFLSIGAANRLLKTLEEPVGKVVFILLTVDDKLLPATVVSRCQRLELFQVPAGQIETALKTNLGIEPEKARLLSRLARGCPGWAISASRDDTLLQRHAEWLDKLIETRTGDSEERFAYANQLANQFSPNRSLVYERLDLWLEWWRDILLMKTGLVDSITNVNRIEDLRILADGLSIGQIRSFIRSIQSAGEQLRQNANAKLVFEILMMDIPQTGKHLEVKSAV
jgi:DNA polymerase III subunit delta'